MRAFPFTFYRDRFGSSYQILSHIGEAVHPAAELMRFSCPVSAQSFLRNLRVPIDFWRNFLTHSKHTGYAARSYNDREYQIRVIALQLIHRHIRVYQFPDLIKKAIRNHHGALYTFVKGPIPYPVEGLRPLTLQNEQQADQLLSSLNITKAEQWHYLLNDHGLLPEGANPHKTPVGEYQAIVAQSLIAGGLLAYQTRDAPTPPTPGEIDLPLQARDKPASLAPDTPKYFTELEYLYDDRSGIPEGVPYVATFSDGSQKQGMLDESGYVYIKDIPAGQVEVEFGDPQAKQQLDAARTELKSYLDSIVSEVQSRGKRLDAELNKLNVLEQGMVLTGAFMVGLYDSAADIVETAKMIAEAGIELMADIDELKLKTFNIVISGDIEAAKQELEDLVAYGEETLGTMQETYTTLQLLYTDGEIKTLLTDFPEQYFKAMPAVEQAGAASGLALSLLFALVTGGAGAAAGAATKAPMFIKAADKLQEIIVLIKKVKLHKKQSRPHNNKIVEKTDKPKEDKLKEKDKKACDGENQRDSCKDATNNLKQTGGGSSTESADELYDAIRASDSDISTIAANTGIKPKNIQKVKDHVFNNQHLLDKYVDYGVPAKKARFDSDLSQAEAWHRLETGTHTQTDINWMKHEVGERWYELKHNAGYTESHNAVESRWPGIPWGEK